MPRWPTTASECRNEGAEILSFPRGVTGVSAPRADAGDSPSALDSFADDLERALALPFDDADARAMWVAMLAELDRGHAPAVLRPMVRL